VRTGTPSAHGDAHAATTGAYITLGDSNPNMRPLSINAAGAPRKAAGSLSDEEHDR